jgi:1,4-alpha-glucan branching enzyme
LPNAGYWREALNSDSGIYGGSNQGNLGGIDARHEPMHHQPFSALLTLPPLSCLVFRQG